MCADVPDDGELVDEGDEDALVNVERGRDGLAKRRFCSATSVSFNT